MKNNRFCHLIVEEALQRASFCFSEAGLEQPRFEAEILLSHTCGIDRLQLLLESEKRLPDKTAAAFLQAVDRRSRAEPAAYITGSREFYGFSFVVNRNVLIPRPETEHLVDAVLDWIGEQGCSGGAGVRGLDLGTGSGNVAVTLAKLLPAASFLAVDLSIDALAVASLNAARHGVAKQVQMFQGSYFRALDSMVPRPRFNLLVSNPPYIPCGEMDNLPDTVRKYEPLVALDGGPDGLSGYRAIMAELRHVLDPPALVALEIGSGQEKAVAGMFRESGIFNSVDVRPDYRGFPRVVLGLA